MMPDTPLISIIIAVFNGANTLQNCLDSIARQRYRNFELIIMDGGSTDGTVTLLERNAPQIAYWESTPDRGIAHAWNKGLQKCRGHWILFMGADDQLHDDAVLTDMAKELAEDAESDLVYGQIVFGDGPFAGRVLGGPFDPATYRRRMLVPHTGCFQRASLFAEIGEFDESFRIAIDYEIFLRKPALKARFVPRLVTTMGGSGLSSKHTVRTLKEGRKAQLKNRADRRWKIEMWHAYYQLRHLLNR